MQQVGAGFGKSADWFHYAPGKLLIPVPDPWIAAVDGHVPAGLRVF